MVRSHSKTRQIFYSKKQPLRWVFLPSLSVVLMVSAIGCQQMPGGSAMRQYQVESDRLLNEFRAQKKRAEELEARNAQLEQRLSESEKLLALGQGTNTGKSRNRKLTDTLDSQRSGITLSERDSTRATSRNNSRDGLSDTLPSTAGRLTSGGNRDPYSMDGSNKNLRGDSSRESQWRPISSPGR